MLPATFQAAVIADQNAKLSIFATRPAISSPLYNFITEGMGTTTLLLLALLIEMQVRLSVAPQLLPQMSPWLCKLTQPLVLYQLLLL
jgi:glycerol uptake facilitator-like aquaporin